MMVTRKHGDVKIIIVLTLALALALALALVHFVTTEWR